MVQQHTVALIQMKYIPLAMYFILYYRLWISEQSGLVQNDIKLLAAAPCSTAPKWALCFSHRTPGETTWQPVFFFFLPPTCRIHVVLHISIKHAAGHFPLCFAAPRNYLYTHAHNVHKLARQDLHMVIFHGIFNALSHWEKQIWDLSNWLWLVIWRTTL